MKQVTPEQFLEVLKNSDRYIETIFEQGGCYQLFVILSTLFDDATPYINQEKNHIVTMINGKFYDITGLVQGDYHLMCESDIELAKGWSFSKNHVLVADECQFCGEPQIL